MSTGRIITSCAVIAAVISCHSHTSKLDDLGKGPPPGVAVSSATGSAAHAVAHEPITATALQPMIHELGLEHHLPKAIVIELAAPVISRESIGQISSQSVVKITPEIAGRLTYSNTSELTFTPARPFAFDTQYTIELAKVETLDGVISPASNQKWSYSFKTPSFKLVSFAPGDVDLIGDNVTVELAFSGPVMPNAAREAAVLTVDGHAPTTITPLPSYDRDVVVFRIDDPKVEIGAKVGVAFKA